MNKSILVFGANGTVGVPLVQALLDRGEKAKAASRTGKVANGAEGVTFEFGKDADLSSVLEDVDRLFLLVPTGQADCIASLSPIIREASIHPIKIVFLSAFGADEHEDHESYKVEQLLKSSGVIHISLRPNWFSDNFHTFWKSDVMQGNLRLPAAHGRTSFIDARDIAACAVAALTADKFDGKAFELTGPESLDYEQAAEILSAATGRHIAYTPLAEDQYIKVRTDEGMPVGFAKTIARLFVPVRAGEYASVTDGVFEMTGVRPRTLADYARNHVRDLSN